MFGDEIDKDSLEWIINDPLCALATCYTSVPRARPTIGLNVLNVNNEVIQDCLQ